MKKYSLLAKLKFKKQIKNTVLAEEVRRRGREGRDWRKEKKKPNDFKETNNGTLVALGVLGLKLILDLEMSTSLF